MKLALILFRHGKIKSSNNIFCGWLNYPLDSQGIAQAKKLSARLARETIDVAFCSDQLRSKQALVEVLARHPGAKVIVDHRLRERHYGTFSGQSKDSLKNDNPAKFHEIHRAYHARIPDGENMYHVSKRVFPFMNDLLRFMQRERVNVAISAHTNSLRLIQEYLEVLPKLEVTKLEHEPTSYKKYFLNFEG